MFVNYLNFIQLVSINLIISFCAKLLYYYIVKALKQAKCSCHPSTGVRDCRFQNISMSYNMTI